MKNLQQKKQFDGEIRKGWDLMSDLAIRPDNLPDTLEDISKFILVGREKLISVRAEIRAIDKLNIAQEVREQKRNECLMLSEALLDAEVKIGELLKQIPKASGGDRKSEAFKSRTVAKFESEKPKEQIIKDLGFNKDQASRFETLADNKDLVEHVKAEARENDDIPTRTRVLELVKQRKEQQQKTDGKGINDYEYIDFCANTFKLYNLGVYGAMRLNTDVEHLKALSSSFDKVITVEREIERIDQAIEKLEAIKNYFKGLQKPQIVR